MSIGAVAVAISAFAACAPRVTDVLAQAYVAPASLNVRGQLGDKSSTITTLKHGDRVAIMDVRRRFVKIRTASGAEGWVDSAELLSAEQMDQLRRSAQHALTLPSEGLATVYEALNIHLDPSRQSPAFARIPEAGSVEVLAYRLEPKTSGPAKRPPLVAEKQQPASRHHKHEQSKDRHLPPMPVAPQPPANWQELSAERIDLAPGATPPVATHTVPRIQTVQEIKKPVVMEQWALVRTKGRQCGWVLARNLMMSIPDEVAQYAEGKRITSYFDLGTVADQEKGIKHNWLWTTLSITGSYDFDGWRVFLWNRRHHRYETSFRERDVIGYFPVHVDPPDANAFGRTFELITRSDNGKLQRRTYLFDGVRVHLTRTEDYQTGESNRGSKAAALEIANLQTKKAQTGWLHREWNALKRTISGTN